MRTRHPLAAFTFAASTIALAGVAHAQQSDPAAHGSAAPITLRSSSATSPHPSGHSSAPPDEGVLLRIAIPGEWQLRFVTLSNIPLATTPGQTQPNTLGQNAYLEMWFRFRPEISIGNSFRIVSQFDVARGILVGDSTQQVELSRDARSTELSPFPLGAFDLRWLFLEYNSPIGLIRAGQQGSHWGLGIVANDGNHAQVFGDYRLGDVSERIAFATRPFGRNSDFVVALAGDLVYRDRLARLMPYDVAVTHGAGEPSQMVTLGGDTVWQGILSLFYQDHLCSTDCERKRIGLYGVYRDWTNRLPGREHDFLRAGVVDLYAHWEWPTPDGGAKIFAGGEFVGIFGRTNFARNAEFAEQDIVQFGGAVEVGVERAQRFRVNLSGGYASGDSNPLDGAQRRMTFNPDYRVGLIMFPELMAWQTARAATIGIDNRVLGRPTPGADLIPTSGGVANAVYFNPTAIVNFNRWIDARAGVVVGASTTDYVDPTQPNLYGSAANYRGGNPRARDLGIELDLGLMARYPLGAGLFLNGGVQGGVMFPGHAFDNGVGESMPPLGLVRVSAGISY